MKDNLLNTIHTSCDKSYVKRESVRGREREEEEEGVLNTPIPCIDIESHTVGMPTNRHIMLAQ